MSLNEAETLDRLVGDWKILQLARGHRFSTDDLTTAWMATRARPEADDLLDLGCGIGSVGYAALAKLPTTTTLTGIEAQEVSVGLARRTAGINGIAGRVNILQGDLRDADSLLEPGRKWPLITGSPPYIPVGKGVMSPVPQRAACRMELRGDVFDYARIAASRLAPGGRFAFVMAAADPRTEAAPVAAGLRVVSRLDVVFREGRTPLIAVLVCANSDEPTQRAPTETLVVRGADGAWTDPYLAFRESMRTPAFTAPSAET